MSLNKKKAGIGKKKAGAVVLIVTGCLVAAGTVAVAAPALKDSALMPDAVSEHVFKEKTKSFATAADAPAKGDLAFVLPAWIPKDAENVKVKVKTTGEAKLIRFTLGAGDRGDRGDRVARGDRVERGGAGAWAGRGADCGAGASRIGEPKLDASWWPDRTPTRSRTECGDFHQYRVAVLGNTVYAWTNGDLSQAVDRPAPGRDKA
ncbi:hypothetical protein ABZ953_20415 [Streptomyces sp. NPDC046465]|uniref:hypothetical protein n=1 Tax=Streptomyces sp. NPDC046465 TaxID=3155810 RepID=UPI0033D1BA66